MSSDIKLPHGAAAVLEHPSGAQVFLVGAAYVSKEAANETKEVITTIQPRCVLLELDKERLKDLEESLKSGDVYNERILELPKRKIIAMLFTGAAPLYLMSTTYVLVGALLGCPMGAEFKAALQAAWQVGSEVIPGDRDARTTLQRYLWKTRYLTYKNAGKMQKPGAPLQIDEPRTPARRHLEEDEGRLDTRYKTSGPKLSDALDTTLRRPDPELKDDWNLDDLALPGGKKGRPTFTDLDLLKRGGCENAEEVAAAFRRIVESGMKGAPIHPVDLLTVRSCGQRVVETYRKKALQEGDNAFRELEYQALAQAKGAAGLEPSLEAMHQVFGHEGDVILTRRLWEAASGAEGRDVVGVVGAARVPGIRSMWPRADTPEFQREIQEYLTVPYTARGSAAVTVPVIATGVVLGYTAWRFPRVALVTAAAGTAVMLPYIFFGTMAMDRWKRFAKRIVDTAKSVDSLGDAGMPDARLQ
ncbi:g2019 [Coccomyxa viridis]|uniref:G2019 protein n=1 Tax=Coccomyxa viridis TaxID=1274662 RepID=A0ABP1FJD2_9CHLO